MKLVPRPGYVFVRRLAERLGGDWSQPAYLARVVVVAVSAGEAEAEFEIGQVVVVYHSVTPAYLDGEPDGDLGSMIAVPIGDIWATEAG